MWFHELPWLIRAAIYCFCFTLIAGNVVGVIYLVSTFRRVLLMAKMERKIKEKINEQNVREVVSGIHERTKR